MGEAKGASTCKAPVFRVTILSGKAPDVSLPTPQASSQKMN